MDKSLLKTRHRLPCMHVVGYTFLHFLSPSKIIIVNYSIYIYIYIYKINDVVNKNEEEK